MSGFSAWHCSCDCRSKEMRATQSFSEVHGKRLEKHGRMGDVAERSSPKMDGVSWRELDRGVSVRMRRWMGLTGTATRCRLGGVRWQEARHGLSDPAGYGIDADAGATLVEMGEISRLLRRGFFRADGAEGHWIELRKKAIDRLAVLFQAQYAKSIAWGNEIRESFSDLRFTDANRVPFPFVRLMREKFNLCSVVTASDGPRLRDLDGHWTLDVSGSYGVNVAGFERYKEWMQKGWERVKELGPVLGPLHPVVAENIARLKSISKKDEVSFHMSGTEAVMAAVRLARFNTRKKLIVCFSGSYHGWWDGVQPGLGSERDLTDCLTLKDVIPGIVGRHSSAGAGDCGRSRQSRASVPSQFAAAQRCGAADQWHTKNAGFHVRICQVVTPIA